MIVDEQLVNDWKKIRDVCDEIDDRSRCAGMDWRTLCVGFCLARGLSLDDARAFCNEMIERNLF